MVIVTFFFKMCAPIQVITHEGRLHHSTTLLLYSVRKRYRQKNSFRKCCSKHSIKICIVTPINSSPPYLLNSCGW